MVIAFVLSASLSACSAFPAAPNSAGPSLNEGIHTMGKTPRQAVDELYAFYAETVRALGEDGWQDPPSDGNVDGQIPDPCRLSDGSQGVRYTTWLDGPGHIDAEAAAHRVAEIWRERGLVVVDRVPVGREDPQVETRGSNEWVVAQYTADATGSSLQILSACVPGSEEVLHRKIVENRERRAHPSPSVSSPAG